MQAEDYKELGNELREQGKLDEALEMYQKAVALQPDYAPAYNNIGLFYKKRGDLTTAIRYYQKAIKFGLTQTYSNLGDVYKMLGKYKHAIKLYYICLRLHPNHINTYHGLGDCLIETGDLDEAILVLESGLQISEISRLYYDLSQAYHLKNNIDKCIENLKKSIAVSTEDNPLYDIEHAYNDLAHLYYDTSQYDLGIEVLQEAITKI